MPSSVSLSSPVSLPLSRTSEDGVALFGGRPRFFAGVFVAGVLDEGVLVTGIFAVGVLVTGVFVAPVFAAVVFLAGVRVDMEFFRLVPAFPDGGVSASATWSDCPEGS